jgi:hypothetical protein
MMNALWISCIVTVSAFFDFIIFALLYSADDSDAQMIALLRRQYEELELFASDEPNLSFLKEQHIKQRAELE